MRRTIATTIAALLMAGCGTGAAPSAIPSAGPTAATTSPAPSPNASSDVVRSDDLVRGHFAVNGASMYLDCEGTGSPTVVFEAGLSGDRTTWSERQQDLRGTTRVCIYDRIGMGRSYGDPNTHVTVGSRADDLYALLKTAEIPGPYIPVGWSFGGMIVRVFAARHAADIAGIVLVDSSMAEQFSDPYWLAFMPTWMDGSHVVDMEPSHAELVAASSFGSVPEIVITRGGDINGDFERHFAPLQDALATMSTNSLHVVAQESGHDINKDQPELLRKAVEAVVAAARSGAKVPPCAGTFDVVGASCLADGTMVGRLAAWDAIRATVKASGAGFPDGTYTMKLTAEALSKAIGEKLNDFYVADHTWTMSKGRWSVSIVTDGGPPETHEGIYAIDGYTMRFVLSDDWRIPGTPGVNTLTWAVDAKGTLTFEQLDDYAVEGSFVSPWVRTGP